MRVIAISLLVVTARLFLSLNLPLQFLYNSRHDDGLFMRLGENLASGRWLGPFNQFTLMKGPGYAVFLALSSLSGLPVSAAHGLFQILAFAVTAWTLLRLGISRMTVALVVVILAFYPAGFVPELERVYRDQIYWAQTLIVVSLFSVLFLAPPTNRRRQVALSVTAGLTLSWTWLTREEGIWLLPGLLVLAGGEVLLARKKKPLQVQAVVRNAAIAAAAFLALNAGFRLGNWIAYGSFVGVDVKQPDFVAALDALQSIDAGAVVPFVPVPAAARTLVARVSPTFRPLAAALAPGSALSNGYQWGCPLDKNTCGDIAAGWFIWAFRDAAAKSGYYRTPLIAAERFRQIADDIAAACQDGTLHCRHAWIDYMPAMTESQWLQLPHSILRMVKKVSFIGTPILSTPPSRPDIDPAAFERYWNFLNHPRISQSPGEELTAHGWYYNKNSVEWPVFQVYTEKGVEIAAKVSRIASPDLQSVFSAGKAGWNRWEITFNCPNRCTLVALNYAGAGLRLPIGQNHPLSVTVGGATLYLDGVSNNSSGILYGNVRQNLGQLIAAGERDVLIRIYDVLAPIVLATGLFAVLLLVAPAVRASVAKGTAPILLVSFTVWTLVLSRIGLLALMDASAGPVADLEYTVPANYLAILAAILSISVLKCPVARIGPWFASFRSGKKPGAPPIDKTLPELPY